MILTIIVVYFVILFFVIWGKNIFHVSSCYWAIGFLLIIIASFRPVGSTPDTISYNNLFLEYDNPLVMLDMEPTFQFFSWVINKYSDDVHWLFFIYAILGVSLKMLAIKRRDFYIFLPLMIYYSNYYILHDLVQIRVGVASALLLLAIKPLGEGKRKRVFLYFVIATLFHYSSLLLFPLLFLKNNYLSLQRRWLLALIVPLAYLIHFIHFDFFSHLSIPIFETKMEAKEIAREAGVESDINVFNLVFLVRIFVFYYVLRFYDLILEYNKYISIELKIMTLSIFCFPAFSTMPVLGFRVSELFGIVDIFIYSSIVYTIRPMYMAKYVLIVMAIVLLSINVFYNELVVNI